VHGKPYSALAPSCIPFGQIYHSFSFRVPSSRELERTSYAIPRCSAAQRSASLRPLGTSTVTQMTRDGTRHVANRNAKPCQIFPVLSIIACTTFGPTMDDARFVNPNKPKNYESPTEQKKKKFPPARKPEKGYRLVDLRVARTIKSNPDGQRSAITVCENAKYGAWNNPKMALYTQNSQLL
jgi:hypothetical protein